ncbi:MAG TPA: type II secretion system F family protein [Candidatus Humimicrobiaceae bacterium]|nr:type II secretion system F family protein [Candidatus Humimicrobiaceae bacterium]
MPKYSYTAQSSQGESKSGVLEAKDEHQLARILRQEGLILIRAEPGGKLAKRNFEISLPSFGVSLTEKLFFTRNLRVMVSAGLPLPRALETLTKQAKNKKFKNAILNIREEIVKGKSFSDSLTKYPDIFSELFQNMVRVGEESGTLEGALQTLSQQIEREYELKSRIKGAMIYPAVIICAMIGIGILMLVMVVPQLAQTFEELEIELPLTTQIVIGIGNFLKEKWYLVIFIIFVLAFLLGRAAKTETGKRIIDKLTLRAPIISPIIRKINTAYTTRTLSSLIAAGVPIIRSLEITSGTLGNIYYKSAITTVAERVKKGEKIAQALEPYENIYPSIVIQMVAVGEETGETSGILAQLAEFFEEEVSNATENLATVIEPVIMLIIGAAIGFFAVSMIQPMYTMIGAI